MFTDKDIANDLLEAKKHAVTEFTKAAMESSNSNLRQTFTQLRNQCEQAQQEIGQLSQRNGWYQPASQAQPHDIQQVLSFLQSDNTMNNFSNNSNYNTNNNSNYNNNNNSNYHNNSNYNNRMV